MKRILFTQKSASDSSTLQIWYILSKYWDNYTNDVDERLRENKRDTVPEKNKKKTEQNSGNRK